MQRQMILLAGLPGSGKSTLGESLARELSPTVSTEHISTGNLVRAIGKGALKSAYSDAINQHMSSPWRDQPLDNPTIYGITAEALERATPAELVLLDGMPRRLGKTDEDFITSRADGQVDDAYLLALRDQRTIAGMIMTHTSFQTGVGRLLRRSPREFQIHYSEELAVERILNYEIELDEVIRVLDSHNLPIETVDTSGSKAATLARGLQAVWRLRLNAD